jgi:hypothetical protein
VVGREAAPHIVKIKLFRNPEEGQGSQRAVVGVMTMMINRVLILKGYGNGE